MDSAKDDEHAAPRSRSVVVRPQYARVAPSRRRRRSDRPSRRASCARESDGERKKATNSADATSTTTTASDSRSRESREGQPESRGDPEGEGGDEALGDDRSGCLGSVIEVTTGIPRADNVAAHRRGQEVVEEQTHEVVPGEARHPSEWPSARRRSPLEGREGDGSVYRRDSSHCPRGIEPRAAVTTSARGSRGEDERQGQHAHRDAHRDPHVPPSRGPATCQGCPRAPSSLRGAAAADPPASRSRSRAMKRGRNAEPATKTAVVKRNTMNSTRTDPVRFWPR